MGALDGLEALVQRIADEQGVSPHQLDLDAIAAMFDDEVVEATLAPVLEVEAFDRDNKFSLLFPDDGPLRRELYTKHCEFFRVGKDYRERCFMAGNRVGKCRTFDDVIEHPDGRVSRIGDLFEAAEPFDVWAWDGAKAVAAPASHVVRKPAEQVVEVLLADGSTFRASLGHRVLTAAGYATLANLLASAPALPASRQASAPSVRAAGDRHWWQTVRGWLARCSGDHHRHDAPPLEDQACVRPLRPSQGDARRHIPAPSPLDAPADAGSGILSQSERHLSTRYGRLRCAVRSAVSLARDAYSYARRTTGSHPGAAPLRAASASLFRSLLAAMPGRGMKNVRALVSPSMAGNHVVAWRMAGYEELYDLTVPTFHNYVADGIIHHNTIAGGYEMTAHLTGLYPDWWQGRTFHRAVRAWAAGDTNETTRDIIQLELFGNVVGGEAGRKVFDGTGLVPRELIGQPKWKQGVQDLADTVPVKHKNGRWSMIGFKSYDQGRRSFQGTAKEVIWLDEECPQDVYGECLMRVATTRGIIMTTFTPLTGLTPLVLEFLPGGKLAA